MNSNNATTSQKQFLRCLGHKDVAGLSKTAASQLIDKLLAEEKASGKKFPCPYCKARFGPRPRRQKKCPSCGNTIYHITGKFYTEQQRDELNWKLDQRNQKDWLHDARKERNYELREEWKEEREFRREVGEVHFVGYMIQAGANCPHAEKLEGLVFLCEDVHDTPNLLPPYDECRHDSCECDHISVTSEEVPKGAQIAEWDDPAQRARLKTRDKSPVSITSLRKNNSGCSITLLGPLTVLICLCTIIAICISP